MKKSTVGDPSQSDEQATLLDHYLSRFKRARCEDTLDHMYKGAVNSAKNEVDERKKFLTLLAIERAYDRCQQDFDGTTLGMTRKANHAINKTLSSPTESYSPEDKLRELLSNM